MRVLRSIHFLTLSVLIALLAFFVWLNLDYSMVPYTEDVPGGGRGGITCGFPFICWDAGELTTATTTSEGQLSLTVQRYGGLQWIGFVGNLCVLLGVLGAVGFICEALRQMILGKSSAAPIERPRVHPLSFAIGLCVTAGLLWLNAQIRIDEIQHSSGKIDYRQTMGWPLNAFTASKPYPFEFKRAEKAALPMLEHLRASPNAAFAIGRWHAQYLGLNCVIGGTLVILSLLLCEVLLQRKRQASALPLPARVDG